VRLASDAEIEMILVGDSLGMVIQGHETTLPVSLDDVLYHTRCVTRAKPNSLVIADLPFLSYQASPTQALFAAGRALQESLADAVKLEGGMEMVETVGQLSQAGIPTVAHIGLKPQQVKAMGGYKIQGRDDSSHSQLIQEALAFEKAGAFMLLLEGIVEEVATEITSIVSIPTIGIGSGANCDGQVLVLHDLLGLNPDFSAKFVKKFFNGYEAMRTALQTYRTEVKAGTFPSAKHSFQKNIATKQKETKSNHENI